ncbi:hypothetical protein F511_26008 [Dorcoceras hygrometricum]|uniref:Uncharacterized protein n=1 Tax=Dorcoceras hygrometricum TaxID=472368 RepID=A0A2Z7BWQ1_9LAMI|nr:hypothetical protein F511_26008 [Dorcoceras hygrometricum]
MAPSVPRTRAAADLRMKQMALDNQSHMIRRLRAKLATKRRESAEINKGLEDKVSSLKRELQLQRCDNHSPRNTLVEAKKEHKSNQVGLEASHTIIAGLAEIGLCMSKKIERMRAKKQQARDRHLECHHKLQARIHQTEDMIQEQHLIIKALARIHQTEDMIQEQHLIIKALVEEKASLLQTIQGLQEDNGAPAPFDDEWEEEPE